MADFAEFQKRLGHSFRDEKLLALALTHPSVAHEQNNPVPHNQRLEFLGDSVLSLVLSRALFEKFPEADEGALTKSRAKLVNSTSLAEHARKLNLGTHLVMSRGEENTGGRDLGLVQGELHLGEVGHESDSNHKSDDPSGPLRVPRMRGQQRPSQAAVSS